MECFSFDDIKTSFSKLNSPIKPVLKMTGMCVKLPIMDWG